MDWTAPDVLLLEQQQERPAILFIDVACLPHAVGQLKDMLAHPTDPSSLSSLLWAFNKPDRPLAS